MANAYCLTTFRLELIKIKNSFYCKNGSGKTTIMNIINGFDEPDTGQVVIRKEIKMAFYHKTTICKTN